MKQTVLILAMLVLAACSQEHFSSTASAGTSVGNPSQPSIDGQSSGQISQPPAGGGTASATPAPPAPGPPPVAAQPQLSVVAPACEPQSLCQIIFNLRQPLPAEVTFNWETNDALYGTPVAAGQYPYGQPGVQYIPVAWQPVSFAPGEMSKTVTVQNINSTGGAIQIGFLMRNCAYGGSPGDCSKYFSQ